MIKRIVAALRTGPADLSLLACLGISFPALFTAAYFASVPATVLLYAVSCYAELRVLPRIPRVAALLEQTGAGAFPRQVTRDAALILLVWQQGSLTSSGKASLTAAMIALYAITAVTRFARAYLVQLRQLPIETRNVDLTALRIPGAPAALVMRGDSIWPSALSAVILAAIVMDWAWQRNLAPAAAWAAPALGLAVLAILLTGVVQNRHLADRDRVFSVIHQEIAASNPEVVLYHSGPDGSAYQVNMWLKTLAALDRSVVVVLRQPDRLRDLEPSPLLVAAIPSGSDVMDLALPSVKTVLYVGNVGDNQHMIRTPGPMHVFVGHGDSDKLSSANPVSKIYDEIWVAGPAGRERYNRSGIRIPDSAFVYVGRPQLRHVAAAPTKKDRRLTVLYAPTWEGWSQDMLLTSLTTMGREIMTGLLSDPDVRVIYRPHPLTGIRTGAVRSASSAISRLLDGSVPATRSTGASHRQDLHGDGAQQARDGLLSRASFAAISRERAEADRAFWMAAGDSHVTVDADGPDLYACFNQCDVLITDISGVVSDFAASEKPYLVTNPANLALDEFASRFPAASAAYILTPQGNELPEVLSHLRGTGPDRMAAARELVRRDLLGPRRADATDAFREAIDAVIAAASHGIPAQRAKTRSVAQING